MDAQDREVYEDSLKTKGNDATKSTKRKPSPHVNGDDSGKLVQKVVPPPSLSRGLFQQPLLPLAL